MTRAEVPEAIERVRSVCVVVVDLLRELAAKPSDSRSLDLQKNFLEATAYIVDTVVDELASVLTALKNE